MVGQAAWVSPEPGASQTEAGRQLRRNGPDDFLVEDDGLPFLVRAHCGQHARNRVSRYAEPG